MAPTDKLKSLVCAAVPSGGFPDASKAAAAFQRFESQVKEEQPVAQMQTDLFKMRVELAFRERVSAAADGRNVRECSALAELAVHTARAGLCAPSLPIVVLADLFELLPLSSCRQLFSCVEANTKAWKEELFFAPVRNHLLRICNGKMEATRMNQDMYLTDLLRRMSRGQDTEFCGRILVFLARFFPVSERSGLNIISEFNLDNETVFADSNEVNQGENEDFKLMIEEDEKKYFDPYLP